MSDLVRCPVCETEQPMDMRIDMLIFGGYTARCECSVCGYKGMWSGAKRERADAKRIAIERADRGVKGK